QTLIATKAARMLIASRGTPVLEFGLRRAQGIDGALTASRAAYIGGCAATSNVLAGKLFGIPVRGTQAHSWVMAFDDEAAAFKAYAKAMPNNCIFLVDTFDTLEGVKRAAKIGKWLRQQGHEMIGIRLDSGDLAHLSIAARRILDAEGFPKAIIVASNELDEETIANFKKKGAQIAVWGVGTKLITAYDQPALGGVYKLSAIREPGGAWKYKVKLSEEKEKVSNPGILQVRRYAEVNQAIADVIYDRKTDLSKGCVMVDLHDITRRQTLAAKHDCIDLLVPVFRKGMRVYPSITIEEIKENVRRNLDCFQAGIKRLIHPKQFPVGLERSLHVLKTNLIRKTTAS
ncbi:MAG: nicotinate phosphoribosyltransferase, partial [Verrucomicrobiota bacterium]